MPINGKQKSKLGYVPDDFPAHIIEAIRHLRSWFPEVTTPEGGKGRCLYFSSLLISMVQEICKKKNMPEPKSEVVACPVHSFAWIDGWCVDLTLRQLEPQSIWPKVWKSEEPPTLDERIQYTEKYY